MLGLIGAALVVVFAGVAWVQWSTLALIKDSVADRTDSLTFAFGQLENEALRLSELMLRDSLQPGSVPPETLTLRYEIFVSRVMQAGGNGENLFDRIGHGKDPTLAQLQAFVASADPLIGEQARRRPEAQEIAALSARFNVLSGQLHDLTLAAYHHDSERTGVRDDAVQLQYRIAVGLTIFQSLLTLAFGVIVVRQLRSAERRRLSLEQLADELGRAQVAAESASRAKSMFVANMSHELRTPFHGLLGMLTLVENGPLTGEQQRHLRTARRSGQHLLSILNDVLDLSKLDSGGLPIEVAVTDMPRLFSEVLALMRPQAQEQGLSLQIALDDELPRRLVLDGKRFKQIMFNLIGNGIKFTRQGRVRVLVDWRQHPDWPAPIEASDATSPADPAAGRAAGDVASTAPREAARVLPAGLMRTSLRPGRARGGLLSVRVIDDGIGMDEDTLARLFQRFAQGDESIQRRFGGTGLGLEISRTLARRMGGDITASSQVGRGSEFSLQLPTEASFAPTQSGDDQVSIYTQPTDLVEPVVRSGRGAAAETGREAGVAARADQHRPATLGLRALVCDDNEVNRLLMQAFLERFGCEPVLCEDGAQAVALARCNHFDLILIDVHMPVLDGFAASCEIRAVLPPGEGPVIVAVTADALDDTRKRAAAIGIDELLPKPLDLADVEACVRRHFPHLLLPH
jgi:signal transduction histidine kinase/ActR/RegA family two-component response regulator